MHVAAHEIGDRWSTIAESGMPDFEVISWQGLCTPSGAPSQALERLQGLASCVPHNV